MTTECSLVLHLTMCMDTHTDTHISIYQSIIMYIYYALINALSAHMIHINLNMIFYTHVEHSPIKTIDIKYYTKNKTNKKALHTHTHTHTCTHTVTVAELGTDIRMEIYTNVALFLQLQTRVYLLFFLSLFLLFLLFYFYEVCYCFGITC